MMNVCECLVSSSKCGLVDGRASSIKRTSRKAPVCALRDSQRGSECPVDLLAKLAHVALDRCRSRLSGRVAPPSSLRSTFNIEAARPDKRRGSLEDEPLEPGMIVDGLVPERV